MLTIDRERSALLIIDFQQRLMPAIEDGAAVVGNARRLLQAAEMLRVPYGTYSVYTAFVESSDSLPWTMGTSPPRTPVGRKPVSRSHVRASKPRTG